MRRRLLSEGGVKATLISQLDTQAGDVVFANPGYEEMYFYRLGDGNDIIPEEYVPIGVVVVPSSDNRYGQYQCGVMSLCDMSCSNPSVGGGNEARKNQMCWGEEVPINEFVTSEDDFDGKEKTDAIIAYRGARSSDWTPERHTPSDYPAASCCNLFYTPGTKQGDWYLPASGEGKYVMENWNLLASVIAKCNSVYGVGAKFDVEYWCSTEYSSTDAYVMNAAFFYYTMQKTYPIISARAFMRIQMLERNYGDIFISGGNVSDIPAGGGSSQVVNYTYSQTYGYGDSTTNGGTITSGADIDVTSVSADTLGTTEKERTKIGDSVLTVSMNGKTATASYAVYQAENKIESSVESGGETTWGDVVAPDNFTFTNVISAAGGSDYVDLGPATQSYVTSQKDVTLTYTSGIDKVMMIAAQESGTVNIPISSIGLAAYFSYSGNRVDVTFPSRDTVLGGEAIHVCTVTYSGNGSKSDTCNVTAKQERNYIESIDYEIFANTITQPVAASGGVNMNTGYTIHGMVVTSGASLGAQYVNISINNWSKNTFTHTNCSSSDYTFDSSNGIITWNSRGAVVGDERTISGTLTCTLNINITGTTYYSTNITGTFIKAVSFATHQAKNGISAMLTYCEQIYHGIFNRVYLYATRVGDITDLSLLTAEVYVTFDSTESLHLLGIRFNTFEERYGYYIDFNGTRGVCNLTYYSSYTSVYLIGTFTYQNTDYTVNIDGYVIGSSYFRGVTVNLTNRNSSYINYSITVSAGDESYINTNVYLTGQLYEEGANTHLFEGIWSNDNDLVNFVKYITNTTYHYVVYDIINLCFTTSLMISVYFDTTTNYGNAYLSKYSSYPVQDRIDIEIL